MATIIFIYIFGICAIFGLIAWFLSYDEKQTHAKLKKRVLNFIQNQNSKWHIILTAVNGNKDTAVRLLEYYFRFIDETRQAFLQNFQRADDLTKYQVSEWLLDYGKQARWKLGGMTMKDLAEQLMTSNDVTKLDLAGEEFFLWLGRKYLYDIKNKNRMAEGLSNPFTEQEINLIK